MKDHNSLFIFVAWLSCHCCAVSWLTLLVVMNYTFLRGLILVCTVEGLSAEKEINYLPDLPIIAQNLSQCLAGRHGIIRELLCK